MITVDGDMSTNDAVFALANGVAGNARVEESTLDHTVLTDALRSLCVELARQIAEISESALVRRVIDLVRLEHAVTNWPTGGWHTPEIFREYNLALTRGIAGGRFLRWFEAANR